MLLGWRLPRPPVPAGPQQLVERSYYTCKLKVSTAVQAAPGAAVAYDHSFHFPPDQVLQATNCLLRRPARKRGQATLLIYWQRKLCA